MIKRVVFYDIFFINHYDANGYEEKTCPRIVAQELTR
jgi:hypothetical protein